MRRALRVGAWAIMGILCCAGAAGSYVYWGLPRVSPPSAAIHAADSSEALARGKYLAENVAICMDCHSTRDFGRFAGPVDPGSHGVGGEVFGHAQGFPGEVVASNITPDMATGVGRWSDAELVQAITMGVTPDGRALFPLMNYPAYAQLCRADLEALLGYIRRLPAVSKAHPRSELDFPVNLIVRTLPKAAQVSDTCLSAQDGLAYGKHLVTIAGCGECHTRHENGAPVAGQEFAGGEPFAFPGYIAHSANITPDPETGIGRWSKEQFIQRFAMYRNPSALGPVQPGQKNTAMPWSQYAGMTDADLGAIYDYLRTLVPIDTGAPKALAAR